MEELKLLVESIANLPDLAIWVIAMYFFFKLAIVGSVFGVIRLFIMKVYEFFKGKNDIKQKELELNEQKNILESQRPIEHIHNLGNISLSANSDVTGKLVELFSLIKNDTSSWSAIRVDDLSEAIRKLKKDD